MGILTGGIERVMVFSLVKGGYGGPWLHWIGCQTIVGDFHLRHMRRRGQSRLSGRQISDLPIKDHVPRGIVMNLRCIWGQSLNGTHHNGQLLIGHNHRLSSQLRL